MGPRPKARTEGYRLAAVVAGNAGEAAAGGAAFPGGSTAGTAIGTAADSAGDPSNAALGRRSGRFFEPRGSSMVAEARSSRSPIMMPS